MQETVSQYLSVTMYEVIQPRYAIHFYSALKQNVYLIYYIYIITGKGYQDNQNLKYKPSSATSLGAQG